MPGDLGEPCDEQLLHLARQFVLGHAGREGVLLQGVEPGVDHGPQRAGREAGGGEPFGEPPVDRLQPMQRGLVLRDLDLGHGEVTALGPLPQPAGEEGLAGPVLAPHGLEHGAAGCHGVQFRVQGRFEPVESGSQQIQSAVGDGAAPERVDDGTATGGAHLGGALGSGGAHGNQSSISTARPYGDRRAAADRYALRAATWRGAQFIESVDGHPKTLLESLSVHNGRVGVGRTWRHSTM